MSDQVNRTTTMMSPIGTSELVLPTLGQTRRFDWSPELAKARGIYGFDSRDIRSRPFNLLRSRLFKLQRAKGWRLFGVISSNPGVGKSFVATNLGASLSRTPDVDTYLVDLDLRRGSLAANFGCASEISIRDYLEGTERSLQQAGLSPSGERLIILPTDSSRVHSAELLSNERMMLLLAEMRAHPPASIFICDLPPVFANDDAAIVTSKLDAYILVVESGQTTRQQVKETVAALEPATCAGVILNRYHSGMLSDNYGYGSSKNYGDYYK